ncbi:MAG: ATP-binding protein [Methanothrix sp.]
MANSCGYRSYYWKINLIISIYIKQFSLDISNDGLDIIKKEYEMEIVIDMDNLDDLIKYENEHSGLDFKAIQYTREKYEDFIKDIMSMANADIGEEGYIIIGVKLRNSTERDILGISKEDFIDSATYQQIISENLEPDINLEYTAYLFESKYLGILKISQCNDQPYMMKKDFGKLKKGDCFIRKGSFQPKMTRQDFDRIMAKKQNNNDFSDAIRIYFSENDQSQEIELSTIGELDYPSERARRKIQAIIGRKKTSAAANSFSLYNSGSLHLFGGVPYEDRSIEELEKNLENLKETYHEEDYYYLFELKSHKLNITIMNLGKSYIEDASIQVNICETDGLLIPEKIYPEPEKPSLSSVISPRVNANLFSSLNYPHVENKENRICIYAKIGNIRHLISIDAFVEPIRILLAEKSAGHELLLNCRLFGKNLKEPFETILKIRVVPNDALHKE